MARGISFEVVYAGMLGAQASVRKDVITGTKSLIQYLNGRNVVLSSGADAYMQLRGPKDVINLAQVIGLSNKDAQHVCRANAARAMRRAFSRERYGTCL